MAASCLSQSLCLLITNIFGVSSGTTNLWTSCQVVRQLNLCCSQSYSLLLLAPEVSLINILGESSGCLWFWLAHHFFPFLFIEESDFHLGNSSPPIQCGPSGTISRDISPRTSGGGVSCDPSWASPTLSQEPASWAAWHRVEGSWSWVIS